VFLGTELFAPGNFNFLLLAAVVTIELSLIAIAAGSIIGLIFGLIRTVQSRILIVPKIIVIFYVESFRRVPLLVLILLSFFAIAVSGFEVSAFFVGSIAISIYAGAYMTENIRAGIEAIRPQQWDAAKALGMTVFQQLYYIIFPQAMRIIIPPSTGFFLGLIKDTSLISVIEVVEITYAAHIIRYKTAESFSVFAAAFFLYFVICYPLSKLGSYLERRLRVHD